MVAVARKVVELVCTRSAVQARLAGAVVYVQFAVGSAESRTATTVNRLRFYVDIAGAAIQTWIDLAPWMRPQFILATPAAESWSASTAVVTHGIRDACSSVFADGRFLLARIPQVNFTVFTGISR